jgi:hypothetical protein
MDKLIILFLVVLNTVLWAVQIVICYQRLASVTSYQPTTFSIP